MYLGKFKTFNKNFGFTKFQHRNFTSVLGNWNKSALAFRMSKYDPSVQLEGHNPTVHSGERHNYQVTRLSNGIRVLTESNGFPSNVHLGIFIDVGTRDENHENSGSLLALKNTYLKTLKHTNETINYGMIQMTGGECEMEYDEESIYYKAHCFEYDATDVFRMMGDMAFEPRSIIAANVAKDKSRSFWKLQHHLHKYHPFGNNPQNFLTTAYGLNTLGMPRNGFESNVENIDSKLLQEFQMSNITPNKVIVCANGVKNHREFVDLAEETLGVLNPVRESEYARTRSEYIGGEYRAFTETPETNIILGYESVPWTHELMPAFAVLHMLFGSATGFSVGGPGKGMLNRSHNEILRSKEYISDCESINLHFSDSGLFALNFTGNSANSSQILNDMVETYNNFRRPISDEELNRAKNMLKRTILLNLENQGERLEESVRNLNTYGQLTFENYSEQVNNVTSQQINQAVEFLLNRRPTLVVTGNAVNLVPSIADITGRLR